MGSSESLSKSRRNSSEMEQSTPTSSLGSPFSPSDRETMEALGKLNSVSSMELGPMTISDTESAREREMNGVTFYSSASESESQNHGEKPKERLRSRRGSPSGSSSGSPRTKRKLRRKSRTSEAPSEKSHRSEGFTGSGYTSTPAAGKIFRNLLILEETLRQQVIQQKTLRRKYLTFLAMLCSLIASISHHLYFAPQTAASRVVLQLVLLALCVTLVLYHLSGEYQKTIVLPRKFLSSTNKGLRQLNVRLVKIKSSYADSLADLIRELVLFLCTMALKCLHTVVPSTKRNPNVKLEVWLVAGQSRCQPKVGLNDVKLSLMPRSFSTDIREGWEVYRNEFWINEGIRRRKNMMSFISKAQETKIIKKDRKERRPKRKLSAAPPSQNSNLNEENLKA
ncbi:putative sporulation-specific protein [Clavispora lusitaniae]|uniref:Sporulation-specific protein n=1 Tax=Clavispora lusitaniae TaxID=36911 RepID=A0ACD0WF57_CLALS|nr:Spo7-like family protein [Clavispora lusitaniae]QFZ25985.1 putative sporulation-specific protein [Clavispora lusitaniae]QFZ30712.1 putative sporulation-specific protein [Clavispora lusitaniae]QFZ36380.1 putative sporulation-specific protein [Clavispora lusitaniae]QFZ42064.1 putative sporulation-specific protein [Clavispora lusitaniae]